jgi:hypothetical protein
MYGSFLLLIWINFVAFMSCAEHVDHPAYFYMSSIVLYLTYYLNNLKQIYMSLQITLLFLTIPSCLLWHVFITYNYYLRITVIPYEQVVFVMFMYFYIMIYLFSEYS